MDVFACEVNFDGDSAFVKISGYLDENSNLSTYELGPAKLVVMDLANLKLMNSKGILTWILWLRSQVRPDVERVFSFVNCPKPFIDQVNMVEGLIPAGSKIESFSVPFICPDCETTVIRLYQAPADFTVETKEAPATWQIPEVKCPECGATAEIDVIEVRYFKFLKSRQA